MALTVLHSTSRYLSPHIRIQLCHSVAGQFSHLPVLHHLHKTSSWGHVKAEARATAGGCASGGCKVLVFERVTLAFGATGHSVALETGIGQM